MYTRKDDIKPFDNRIWLASPTMHGDELRYMMEAYETNWMSTVGANINEVERIAAEKVKFYSSRVVLSKQLETNLPNVFAIGDGAGVTRGLSQAGASGVYVARTILSRLG